VVYRFSLQNNDGLISVLHPKLSTDLQNVCSNFFSTCQWPTVKFQTSTPVTAGLKLNGTHQFLAYADDVNLPGDNIGTINKIHTNPN
jgi:hypothetical protein